MARKSSLFGSRSQPGRGFVFVGSLIGLIAGAPIGYLFGRYIVPATDAATSLGGARGASALFLWIVAIAGAAAGAKIGENIFQQRRHREIQQMRRERYKETLERYEKEKEQAGLAEKKDGYDGDRMRSSRRVAKQRGYESPWP